MTRAENYNPMPGTIPARVLAHFATLPPGAELSTRVLCDALDLDVVGFGKSLETAVKHDLLRCQKVNGWLVWTLGERKPAPVDDDEEDKLPVKRRVESRMPDAPALRFAMWSDGRLEIDRAGEIVQFSRSDTRAIVAYLEQVGSIGA